MTYFYGSNRIECEDFVLCISAILNWILSGLFHSQIYSLNLTNFTSPWGGLVKFNLIPHFSSPSFLTLHKFSAIFAFIKSEECRGIFQSKLCQIVHLETCRLAELVVAEIANNQGSTSLFLYFHDSNS